MNKRQAKLQLIINLLELACDLDDKELLQMVIEGVIDDLKDLL